MGSAVPAPAGTAAGRARRSGIGTRRIADRQTFTHLRKTLVQNWQNRALGNNGGCSGDSGGLTYYQTNSDEVVRRVCAANPANVKNCGF
jgi:hypothetical protein